MERLGGIISGHGLAPVIAVADPPWYIPPHDNLITRRGQHSA